LRTLQSDMATSPKSPAVPGAGSFTSMAPYGGPGATGIAPTGARQDGRTQWIIKRLKDALGWVSTCRFHGISMCSS
jgi:hypothetical protein